MKIKSLSYLPKKRKIFIIAVILFVLFVSAYCLLFTEKGLGLLAKAALARYVKPGDVEIRKIEGTLPLFASFHDVLLEDLKYMPHGALLDIKRLDVSVNPFRPGDSSLAAHNGKLLIPGSDPVLFHGTYKDGSLDFNIYSRSININQALHIAQANDLKDITGTVNDLDIYINGGFLEPELTGGFYVRALSRRGFLLSDCEVSLDLKLKNIAAGPEIYGGINLNNGRVSGPRTAEVRISAGKIFLRGRSGQPFFDLRGISDVGGVRINVGLRGTAEEPDIRLSSKPSLPKGLLLLMLATNKSWKGVKGVIDGGQISTDIVKDFVDYFFFAGTGTKIARYFGIS
ncbi:MAG TPA: hypothetical protein ENN55_01490, partial [Firmicutes bacterium]|nr:hypothetical protein [Bacillota bacterium]